MKTSRNLLLLGVLAACGAQAAPNDFDAVGPQHALFVMTNNEINTATATARAASIARAPFQVRRWMVMTAALMMSLLRRRTARWKVSRRQ